MRKLKRSASWKITAFSILHFTFFILSGCRREDYRVMTVEIPALKAADQAVIVKELAKYDGIDKSSYQWDMVSKTLTLRYDSMKIAQANIRYAIDEKGIRVKFPEKVGEHAGH